MGNKYFKNDVDIWININKLKDTCLYGSVLVCL